MQPQLVIAPLAPPELSAEVQSRFGHFIAGGVNPGAHRRDRVAEPLSRELLAEAGELGLMGFNLPRAIGGGGRRWSEWGLVLHEISTLTTDTALPMLLAYCGTVAKLLWETGRDDLIALGQRLSHRRREGTDRQRPHRRPGHDLRAQRGVTRPDDLPGRALRPGRRDHALSRDGVARGGPGALAFERRRAPGRARPRRGRWSQFLEVPALVGASRESMALAQGQGVPVLRGGLSQPLRRFSMELARPYFWFQPGSVESVAYRHEDRLALVHRLLSTVPGEELHGTIVERF